MTFEEWFNEQYPQDYDDNSADFRIQLYEACEAAWEAGVRQGYFECTPNWG